MNIKLQDIILSPEEFALLKRFTIGGVKVDPKSDDESFNLLLNSLVDKELVHKKGELDDGSLIYRISAYGKKIYKTEVGIPLGGEEQIED